MSDTCLQIETVILRLPSVVVAKITGNVRSYTEDDYKMYFFMDELLSVRI